MPGLLLIFTLMAGLAAAPAQVPAHATDGTIYQAVMKIVQARPDARNVRVAVEDAVVTLSGTVARESSRIDIARKIQRVAHVAEVENQITIDPPALPDPELSARVRSRMNDAGFEEIRFTVRNGLVRLQGTVRSRKERGALLRVVHQTEGVREIDAANLTAASQR